MWIKAPEISTPDFWAANIDDIEAQIQGVKEGKVTQIGTSFAGHRLWAVEFPGKSEVTFALLGGMHGHEPEGPVACLNIINVLEKGTDLKGKEWPEINREITWIILPLINPDGRVRNPNSFVGLSQQDVMNYGQGIGLQGERYEFAPQEDPEKMLILGGLYNDAGKQCYFPETPERQAVMGYLKNRRPSLLLEYHAHCTPPQIYCHSALPEEIRQKQVELERSIREEAAERGIVFIEPKFHGSKPFTEYYYQCGALPLLYESPQGVVEQDRIWTHEEIVDVAILVPEQMANQAKAMIR